ncbi:MAG: hypothetical protein IT305_24835 [Chloroflexi bacterium]|nr:hypothetical protein [Chloroflexota bacterium]
MVSPNGQWTRRRFLKSMTVLSIAGGASLLAACQQAPSTAPAPKTEAKPAESKPTASKPAEAKPAAPAAQAQPTTAPQPASKPAAQTAPTQAEAKPAAQAAPAQGAPKPGGSTVWTAEVDPVDLDPHTTSNFSSAQAWGDLTYQSLVMFDENMKVVPCLAESWANPDPTTWTFKLRQGVKFHDGNEFEAEDVKFWYDRMMAPETAAPYKSWYNQITSAEPNGKYDITFKLSAPYAPFLVTFAAMRGSAMASRKWMQNAGAATKTSTVGTGPFKIAEYVPQSHIRYVKNPDYWEKGLPYLDEVTFKIATDEETRVAGLRSGQVKYAFIGPEAAQRLKSDKNITILSAAGPSQRVTNLNTKRKPFDDVRVRQAIALTIDRQAAIEKSLNGEGKLTGPMPTGHGDWPIPPDKLPYKRDVARAKQLLAEAGYPNGFESTIKTTPDYPTMLSTSIILADQLKEIGINLKVEQMEWGTLVKAITTKDYDIHSNGNSFFPDPDSYFYLKYHSKGAQNFSSWENAKYDGIIDKARTLSDQAERKKLYDEAAGILMDEAPLIWWFTENNIEAVANSIKGYSQSFTGRRIFLKKTWVEG